MRTASWTTYSGPGRVALSPAPAGTPRGYRLAPAALFLRSPITAIALREHLAGLDPHVVLAETYANAYPREPVIMGEAAPGATSLRTVIADWFSFHGHSVTELDPETHRPRRVRPMAVAGLCALLAASSAAGAATLETITDGSTGCSYIVVGGAVTPRLRRDGLPDCPETSTPVRDETVRDLMREVTSLRREVERRR